MFRRRETWEELERHLTAVLTRWGRSYDIGGWQGCWQAVHRHSGTELLPARTLDGLDAVILADSSRRTVRTLGGTVIAIRAGGPR
jgi:hypothetical protein